MDLKKMYYEWICGMVLPRRKSSYKKLCRHLQDTIFRASLPMDINREEDGIDLRYRFAYENNIDERLVAFKLDNEPCSVLEMMAALALRCEEDIMGDPEEGNRIDEWFWVMICSMGLSMENDARYEYEKVDKAIKAMLDRTYRFDGKGGLFYIRGCKKDMRNAEIWYQMCWYMDTIIKEERS